MNGFKNLLKNLMIAMLVVGLVVGPNSMIALSDSNGGDIESKATQSLNSKYLNGETTKFVGTKYGIWQNNKDVSEKIVELDKPFNVYLNFGFKIGEGVANSISNNTEGYISIFENANIVEKPDWKDKAIKGAYDEEGNPIDVGNISLINDGNNVVLKFKFGGDGKEEVFKQEKNIKVFLDLQMSQNDFQTLTPKTVFTFLGKEYVFLNSFVPNAPIDVEVSHLTNVKEKEFTVTMKFNSPIDLDGLTVNSVLSVNREQTKEIKPDFVEEVLGKYVSGTLVTGDDWENMVKKTEGLTITSDGKSFSYTFPKGTGKSEYLKMKFSMGGGVGNKVDKKFLNQTPEIFGFENTIKVTKGTDDIKSNIHLPVSAETFSYTRPKGVIPFKIHRQEWMEISTGGDKFLTYEGKDKDEEFYVEFNKTKQSNENMTISFTIPEYVDPDYLNKNDYPLNITTTNGSPYQNIAKEVTRTVNNGMVTYSWKSPNLINSNLIMRAGFKYKSSFAKKKFEFVARASSDEIKGTADGQEDFFEARKEITFSTKNYSVSLNKNGEIAKEDNKINWELRLSPDLKEETGLWGYKIYDLVLNTRDPNVLGDQLWKLSPKLSFSEDPNLIPDVAKPSDAYLNEKYPIIDSETNQPRLRTPEELNEAKETHIKDVFSQLFISNGSDGFRPIGQTFVEKSLEPIKKESGLDYKLYPVYKDGNEIGKLLEISGFKQDQTTYNIKYQTQVEDDKLYVVRKDRVDNKVYKATVNTARIAKNERMASFNSSSQKSFYIEGQVFKVAVKAKDVEKALEGNTEWETCYYSTDKAYSYDKNAVVLAIYLNRYNNELGRKLPEKLGNININEALPSGWVFEKINDQKDFLVFEHKSSTKTLLNDHPFEADSFVGKSQLNLKLKSQELPNMVILVKAVPTSQKLIEYAERGETSSEKFTTTLKGNKNDLTLISEDIENILFNKKVLFKNQETPKKQSNGKWLIKWKIDYTPKGIMRDADEIYIVDTLSENLNIKLTSDGKPDFTPGNFKLFEAKLKPGTQELDTSTLNEVSIDYSKLSFNTSEKTMELQVPDKNKNYRFEYLTEMGKIGDDTFTSNIVRLRGSKIEAVVGRRIDVTGMGVSTQTDIKSNINIVWKALDERKLDEFKNKYSSSQVNLSLIKDKKDAVRELALKLNEDKTEIKNIPILWNEDGTITTYALQFDKTYSPVGYTSEISGDAFKGFTITNTELPPEKRVINVIKKWVNGVGTSIKLKLFADGTLAKEEIVAKGNAAVNGNEWSYTFNDLDKFQADRTTPINYTLEEEPLEGYTTVVTGDMENGFVITNTKIGTTPGKLKPPVDPEPQKPEDKTPDEPKPPVTPEETKPEVKPEPTPQPQPEPKPNPQPNNPRPAYERNNVPDPNDPNSPDEITLIDENGVPLGNYEKKTNPDGTVEYVIMEEDVPLTNMLPKTGGMGVYIFIALGLGVSLAGLLLMRRKD